MPDPGGPLRQDRWITELPWRGQVRGPTTKARCPRSFELINKECRRGGITEGAE